MTYIVSNAERKKGKVGLLMTVPGRFEKFGTPDPEEEGNVVYFLFSRLIDEQNSGRTEERGSSVQLLESVAVALDLHEGLSFGIIPIGRHRAEVDHDISDCVHHQAYAMICEAKKIEKIGSTEQDTDFATNLTLNGWARTCSVLSRVRDLRIKNRIDNPRKGKDGGRFDDELIDIAVGHIMRKVNSVMNDILYHGDLTCVSFNFNMEGAEIEA